MTSRSVLRRAAGHGRSTGTFESSLRASAQKAVGRRCVFNRCFPVAVILAKEVNGRILQVKGFLGDGSHADPRWRNIPQDAWGHYVVEKDGFVVDATFQQFDATVTEPVVLPKAAFLAQWRKSYEVDA